jgi:hypothetical protein
MRKGTTAGSDVQSPCRPVALKQGVRATSPCLPLHSCQSSTKENSGRRPLICSSDVVLSCVTRLSHLWQFVLVFRVDSFKHWSVFHHIWYNDEPYLAASDVHILNHPLLPILHMQSKGSFGGLSTHDISQQQDHIKQSRIKPPKRGIGSKHSPP